MAELSQPNLAADPSAQRTVHHTSSRKRRGRPPARMGVDLSSMIDVIFQLLIYFVVTANFTPDEGVLTLKLPQGAGPAEQTRTEPPESPLKINLTSVAPAGVDIRLGAQDVGGSFQTLARRLKTLQFNKRNPSGIYKPDNPIIIRPDGEVRWQHVVNAFNATLRSRYSNVAFARATQ